MKIFIRNAKMIAFAIMAITFWACSDDDDENLPEVVAGFTQTINQNTGTVTFINTSENATSFSWDFGDGNSSTEINPIQSYVNGTYTVTLTATNVAGGSGTFEDTFTILIPESISLPVTFDVDNVNYDVTTFGGASFEIVTNPDVSGSNNVASNVGAITNSGAAFEGIFFDLGNPLDLTTDKTVQMNFWSEEAIDVLLKLEEGTAGDIEATASHGGTGWETITFDFNSSDQYSRLTLFADGPGTTAGTFFFDDVEQVETASGSGCTETPIAAASLPLDFEGCETFLSSENFGSGITSAVVANPFQEGINTSDFVLQVDKADGADFFAGVQNTFASNFDLTTDNVFSVMVYSTKANVEFRFELALNPQSDPVTGNPAPVFATIANANEWTEVEFSFTGLPGGPMAYNQLVIKPDNDMADSPIVGSGTYYIDNLTLGSAGGGGFDDGLLTNGDFENGTEGWTGNALNVVTEGGNSFNLANVTTAGNAFDVNLSQVLELTQDANYILTFDASSDRDRGIIAGIGLNVAPFTNTSQTVNLTTTTQTFTLNLNATGFGGVDSRVLFDMGAEIGTVVIDNVSLMLDNGGGDTTPPVITLVGAETINLTVGETFTDPGATASDDTDGDISGSIMVGGDAVDTNTAGTYVITYNVRDAAGNAAPEVTRTVIVAAGGFDDGLLTNGDFEDGMTAWIGNAFNVQTDGGNSFNFADVMTAGTPFSVNLSQVLNLTQDADYVLTFDASSDRSRTMIAGIGLNVGPFTNTSQSVDLTTTTQTFTLTLNATGFGGADSRVLFDMGAEVGTVVIDNVSLVLAGGGGSDTTPPVITLNGDATVNLTVGDTFTDPGATATDDTDGDISGNIMVGGDAVDTNNAGTYVITYNVSDAAGNPAAQVTRTVNVTAPGAFDDGLLTNGDFESGMTAWIGNAFNVQTDGGNSFNFADVMTAGTPFSVNLSQVVELTQDADYILTFDASSDRSRTMIAGIGLNIGPFTNTSQSVDLTTTTQTFTLNLNATGFGGVDSRVLFDMGAAVGTVVIDNVSLTLDGGSGGGGGGGSAGNLANNGDFETGDATGWELFQNGGSSSIDNTMSNGGGSSSGRLVINAPGNPALKQNFLGAGTVTNGDVVQVQFDHIGALVPPGAVFNVLLFGEQAGAGASFTHVFNPGPALTGSWTTFTGTFTIPDGLDVTAGVSLLIEAVCGGDSGCSVTANIDNLSVTLNP